MQGRGGTGHPAPQRVPSPFVLPLATQPVKSDTSAE